MRPLCIWRFCDGKTGHERQSTGLLRALQDIDVTISHDVPPRARLPMTQSPDLIIGAGRRCRWPMLQAKRIHGGRAVYLMNPGPMRPLFDLSLIPVHDGVRASRRVIHTQGVLNDLKAGSAQRVSGVLILIGGPSRHHGWNEDHLIEQVRQINAASANQTVTITTSRRTPASTAQRLTLLAGDSLSVHASTTTSPGWLAEQLSEVQTVWVSADSISMLFEALTAGTPVGVLEVPVRRTDRISAVAPALARDGQITTFASWRRGGTIRAPRTPLAEAQRCAKLIHTRWFAQRLPA